MPNKIGLQSLDKELANEIIAYWYIFYGRSREETLKILKQREEEQNAK